MHRSAVLIACLLSSVSLVSLGTSQTPTEDLLVPAGSTSSTFTAAISGDTVAVGAPFEGSGAVYVFERVGDSWVEQAKLNANNLDATSVGDAIAFDGDTIVAGGRVPAPPLGTDGRAYVFQRTGGIWSGGVELVATDGLGKGFGESVAIDGDTIVVGDCYHNPGPGYLTGAAYVFKRDGSAWIPGGKLTAGDGAASDEFGYSVAISGDTIVVGAHLDDDAGTNSGSAYVFERTLATWTQNAKLTASDGAAFDQFSGSVAVSGDTVVIGASAADHSGGTQRGAAYVYRRPMAGWSGNLTEDAKLIASDPDGQDAFGGRVAIEGNLIVATAPSDDLFYPLENTGSAYVFWRTGNAWIELIKLIASDVSSVNKGFGGTADISGRTIVVSNRTKAYVYEFPAAFSTFGTGCPGTVGTPTLDAVPGQLPWIGEVFTVELSGLPVSPANIPGGILGLSRTQWGQVALPTDLSFLGVWNCQLFVSPDAIGPLVNSGGTATWAIPLPENPFLGGLSIYLQGLVIDFGVNPANAILTNACEVVLGIR